jgi:hypothetical protein
MILNNDNNRSRKGDFIPELSPNYNPHTGMMETNDRPVRMINTDSANAGVIAKKWIIKN